MEYFKISEAASLTNVSRQTLIYYDKVNILKPAFIMENKYRCYTTSQIRQLQVINILKEFDIPLKTIRSYIDNKDKDELNDLLEHLKAQMIERIEKTKHSLFTIENRQELLNQSNAIENFDRIIVQEKESIALFCSNKLEDDQSHGHLDSIRAFEKKLKEYDIVGMGRDVIVDKEHLNKNYNNMISYFCVRVDGSRKDIPITYTPSGLYVTGYHKGTNQTSYLTYRKIIDYIANSRYEIDGICYECSLSDFLTEKDDNDYLSQISVKVRVENS